MKYRTLIELECDAVDKDDAVNIAGEYLSGKIDTGVFLTSKTTTIRAHRASKFATGSLLAFLLLMVSAVSCVTPSLNSQPSRTSIMPSTCTVMPELKTKDSDEFKREWDEKQEEIILDYIKYD